MHFSKYDKNMNLIKKIILLTFFFILNSCANYEIDKSSNLKVKKFYSSKGFALIYNADLYEQRIIDKKISNNKKLDNKLNNEKLIAMHTSLKRNTLIQIINPENSKVVETKIFRRIDHPKIFNLVVSKKIVSMLELDENNPYVEVFEVKKNKTFVAKKSNTFDEERMVAEVVPVGEVKMDVLSNENVSTENEIKINKNFVLVISDFYYYDSANNLKKDLIQKTQINKFTIKKINHNKYRLSVGPFENFNALKSVYISLNNLGFDELDVYRE
tara:strand:+ start:2581 stop:3393 length:813 start_codon:yes stop_codon:yes gene_type:complete